MPKGSAPKEKIFIDKTLGKITVRKSPRARKRISFKVTPENGVVVTIPRWLTYRAGLLFLIPRREWALDCLKRQAEAEMVPGNGITQEERDSLVEKMRAEAKLTLIPRLRELAGRYGFSPGRVTIKHNSSNWGSCSRLGNINLNLNLMQVPEPCRDYVILHELCHLRYLNHGKEFHALLDSLVSDAIGEPWTTAICRKELKKYKLI